MTSITPPAPYAATNITPIEKGDHAMSLTFLLLMIAAAVVFVAIAVIFISHR